MILSIWKITFVRNIYCFCYTNIYWTELTPFHVPSRVFAAEGLPKSAERSQTYSFPENMETVLLPLLDFLLELVWYSTVCWYKNKIIWAFYMLCFQNNKKDFRKLRRMPSLKA